MLERTGLAYVTQAEQQGLTLRIAAADDLPSVSVDLERMTQVLNNLVVNALRHTAEGEIVLSAQQTGSGIELVVQDSGRGINAEDLPHIFDGFYRADKARERGAEEEGAARPGSGWPLPAPSSRRTVASSAPSRYWGKGHALLSQFPWRNPGRASDNG